VVGFAIKVIITTWMGKYRNKNCKSSNRRNQKLFLRTFVLYSFSVDHLSK